MKSSLPPPKPGDSPIRQVEWPEAARLAAIKSQLLDFDIALNALGRIRNNSMASGMDPVIRHALYASALNYYARTFKGGVRDGDACTTDSLAFSPEEKEEHDRLIALRDKWIAHSVNLLDQVAVGIVLTSFESDAAVLDIGHIQHRKLNISDEKIQKIEVFIRTIRQRLEVKHRQAYEQLLAKARATPIGELQSLPELSVVVPDDDLETVTRRRPKIT